MGKDLTHVYLWLVEAHSISCCQEDSHVLTRAEVLKPLVVVMGGFWFYLVDM